MLMTQSLTIINQFPDHPFAHPSWSWETATATTGKYISPMLPALLQIWVCSCYRKATFLTCGLRFLYQWSCFHFVTLPMTLAALPNNPLPPVHHHGQAFPLGEIPCQPNPDYCFSLIILPYGNKLTRPPLSDCSLETRITVLALKFFKETIRD